MQNLVIVESPTKARTLAKYLGGKYEVEASMGHIRDLPKADLGVDIENNFEPKYIIPRDKTKKVNELKKLASSVQSIWLATDPDREGEAIAWHINTIFESDRIKKGKKAQPVEVKRVVFHEITPEAVKEAFENPRDIDVKLVDAQQARRILDRLVGYKLSPLLWKKIKSGLSAGRVQTVALRLIVEKEKEIEAFKSAEYWTVDVELISDEGKEKKFKASVVEYSNKKLAVKNKEEADGHLERLAKANYRIRQIIKKEVRKYPAPPFTTSTLQQQSANKLNLSAKKTMTVAQHLYEHGLISYMRTDSVNLADTAIKQIRNYIEQNIGKAYMPEQARHYKTKSKVAQEAHEAIRPTNIKMQAEEIKNMEGFSRDHVRLYDLIWKRTLACQMTEAVYDQTSVEITAGDYGLKATGSVIKFDGFLKIYGKGVVDEDDEEVGKQPLPELSEGELLNLLQLLPEQHFTEPPARYNDASLIKKLEELGIGRPSTYASILSTIQDRYYVEKKEKRFVPTVLGVTVVNFVGQYFPDIIDYTFTAEMEESLDSVARGEQQWKPLIADFYKPFEQKIITVGETAEKVKIADEVVDKKCPLCNKDLVVKFGKFGKFLACSGFPDCKHTESIEEKVSAKCPDCGSEIVMRKTKKGRPFYGCKNWPNCKFASWTKPKG